MKNGEIYQIAKGNGCLPSLIPEKQRLTKTILRNEEGMDEKKTGMGLLRDAVRLLCAVPGNAGCGVAYALGNGCGDHESCSECVGASLATIADRIEREREELDKRLMPEGMEWPRFEGGEKVKHGDEFVCEESQTRSWGVGNVGKASFVKIYSGGTVALCSGNREHVFPCGHRVKRPKPAVLAADGLPIEVGEIVYGGDGEAWEVTGIENGPWSIVGKNGSKQREMKPKWLTHEVPTIYGNDGLPLLPGRKVRTGAGFCMTVESVHYDKCPYGRIAKWVRYESGEWDFAESVLHVEPKDTQERIDDDSRLNPIPYARDVLHRDNWGRLTERQAFRLMIDDLMRRKHELDVRTMGGAR